MVRQFIAALALTFMGTHVSAQVVNECDWQASAWNLVEPWETNSRTFSNGRTRLALLDTIEPGAAPLHILVLSPPEDELGGRQCRVVSLHDGFGFAGIEFDRLTASYNPATGLSFRVPVQEYDAGNAFMRGWTLAFTLNQATGQIATWREN